MASSDEKEILLQADTAHELERSKITVAEDVLIANSEDIAVAIPSLRKSLTLINGISFVVNLIVGSGIFTSPGLVLQSAGSVALAFAAWIVAGIIAVCSGLVYADLGSSFPSAGGDAHYYEVAFGKLVAYVYVWTLFFVINGGDTALLALTFARYAAYAIFSLDVQAENVDSDIRVQALGIGCIAVTTIFNCFRVEVRNVLQYIFLLLKFTLVVLIGVAALIFVSRDTSIIKHNFSEASKGGKLSGFGPAVIAALWSFMGWNGVIFLTEEMKNPKKDVSRAIFGGIAIVSFIYLCLNAAYLSVLTTTEIKSSAVIGMETATVAMGGHAGQIIAILVATSTLGTLNSAVLYHGRYLYAAARSGYIFSWMRYIGKESGAPSVALLAHGLWCIFLLIVLKSFHQILYYFGPVGLFFCGLTAAAHIKIRRESPDLLRADTVAFYPYIPIIVMLVCLYVPLSLLCSCAIIMLVFVGSCSFFGEIVNLNETVKNKVASKNEPKEKKYKSRRLHVRSLHS